MKRSRPVYLLLWGAVIALGLATRRFPGAWPGWMAAYGGDTLWALMVFLGLGVLFPRWPTAKLMLAALLVSYAVEVSQLYHAPWIDAIRATRLGGLVLGYTFLWSDMACYTVGVCLGGLVDVLLLQFTDAKQSAL